MTSILKSLKEKNESKFVEFDAKNAEHMVAFVALRYSGRQLPSLRFFLEHPYKDVVTMMQNKIVEAYLNGETFRATK